jgi:outer membrane immunogenic protein
MTKYLLAGVALVALSSAASAADIVEPAPVYDWSGFYVGVNAGVAWNNSNVDSDVNSDELGPIADELKDKIQGDQTVFTAGGLIGFNWQIDSVVLGLETDINWLNFDDDHDRHFVFDDDTVDTKLSFESSYFGTIRGRLGFAADNVLFYGTGGLAYGHVEADGRIVLNDTERWDGSASETNWGWTLGGGVEYAFDNFIIGAEYLYVDLGSPDFDFSRNPDFPDTEFNGNVDVAFSVVRATAKFKFW